MKKVNKTSGKTNPGVAASQPKNSGGAMPANRAAGGAAQKNSKESF